MNHGIYMPWRTVISSRLSMYLAVSCPLPSIVHAVDKRGTGEYEVKNRGERGERGRGGKERKKGKGRELSGDMY